MTGRALVLIATLTFGGAAAAQQAVRDVGDPSITSRPRLDFTISPLLDYPEAAMRKRLEGDVKIRTCVDASGAANTVSVLESSGHPILDEASRKWTAERARFKPAEAGGVPVAVCNYVFTYAWKAPDGGFPPLDETADYLDATYLKPDELPAVLWTPPLLPYPPGALARRASGVVEYELCVAPDGTPKNFTRIADSVDEELVVMALVWVSNVRYRPGRKDGEPVGVCGIKLAYRWTLTATPPTAL
jgi:TonB family protein